MSGCLTLYSPLTCLATSSESLTTSTSVAPSARARSRPSSRPRYSATLLVVSPRTAVASSSTAPSAAAVSTAAAAAGPGLPRAPPSTWTTTLTRSLRVELGELAGDARAATVAQLTAVGAVVAVAVATLGLAAVDDDLDAGVVGVVRLHAVIQLGRKLLRDDAVDHRV